MSYKRPFYDAETSEVGCKHLRQEIVADHLSANVGSACRSGFSEEKFSGSYNTKGCNNGGKSQLEATFNKDVLHEHESGPQGGLEVNASGNTSGSFWVDQNALDKYSEQESTVPLPFFPHLFESDHQVVQPRNIYLFLLEQPPIKLVSMGPDYQADIPELDSDYCIKSLSSMADDDYECADRRGTCVIPMPDLEAPENCFVGKGLNGCCNCPDRDSIPCVRKHVNEAREKLKERLGMKVFEELGFCDMGDEVAKRWTEEEEKTFHDVVLMNPFSHGKNFWHNLLDVFPSMSKRKLVSYYYNVFILRRRAVENRFDPLNIDSDNDEWQISEESSGVEFVDEEEDPLHEQKNHEDSFKKGGDIDDVFQLQGKVSSNNREDHDLQDESCTSYEYQNTIKVNSDGPSDMRTADGDSI